MLRFKENDKVRVISSGFVGTVKVAQEQEGPFAEGYFIKFDDVPMLLFMSEYCVELALDYEALSQKKDLNLFDYI